MCAFGSVSIVALLETEGISYAILIVNNFLMTVLLVVKQQ